MSPPGSITAIHVLIRYPDTPPDREQGGPPPEKTITLASLVAPRMVRAPRPDRFAISNPSSTKARPEADFWSSARSVLAVTPATPRALTRIRLRSPPSSPKTKPQARRDGRDEPFAFASREFPRRLLIGKQVKFRVEYAVQSIGREFGQVYVGDVNAAVESVANGWAKVRVGGGDQASNH